MRNAGSFRRFGVSLVGSVPWGTHLCQFYESKQDLIDILVPYFAEGLRSNEFCMWVTSPPLEAEEAREALQKAVPNLDEYFKKGQIEITSYNNWYLLDGKFDSNRVLQGWVEKERAALKHGFEGLRLTGNTFWIERELWNSFVDYEEALNSVIGQYRMLVLCTYCLKNCSGSDVLDVIRNHVGTLIKQGEKWSLVEDVLHRKKTEEALKVREQDYLSLFSNMMDGFAYNKMVLDADGKPVDYVFLEVNNAFERLTGLKRENILGKLVTQVLPGIEKEPADWIGIYGRVAVTCESVKFENYSQALDKWFVVSAFCPEKGYFVATFEDSTERKKLENSFRESEERFRFALQNTPVIVGNLDCDLRFTWVYNLQSGFKSEDLIGKKFGTGMTFENMEDILGCFNRVIAQGKPTRCEVRGRGPAGERVFDFYVEPRRKENGEIVGVSFTALNITGLRKAEGALRKSEQRWATTLSSIGDAVIATDVAGKVTFMNNVAEDLTGWTLTEALLRPLKEIFNIINEQTRQEVENPVTHVLQEGRVVGLANHSILVRKDGSNVPIDDSGGPIKDKDGNVTGVVLVFRDITERKKAEDAIRKSEQRYRSYIEVTGELGWTTNADGEVVEDIPSWRNFTGQTFEEVKGSGWSKALHPDDLEKTLKTWKRATQEKSKYEVEYRLRRNDGVYRYLMTRGVPVFKEDGNIREWVGTCIDITERKQNEEKLRRLNRTLRAISNSSQALMRATGEASFLQEACRIIQEDCGYKMVWVGLAEDDEAKSVRPVAYAGFEKGYLDSLKITWADAERGRGPTGKAIRTGQPQFCQNMQTDPAFKPWREEALKRGYASSIALPLKSGNKVFGALTMYSTEPDSCSEDEVKLLTELASDFAHGITTLHLRSENERAEAEIRKQATLIDLSPDAIIVRKLDGTITFWSKGAEKLYGWTREEAIGQNNHKLLKTKFAEPYESVIAELKRTGKWSGELIHTAKTGRQVTVQSWWQPKLDQQGEIVELLESNVDITERKKSEETLRESEKRLNLSQEIAHLGSWELDLTTDKLSWSDEVYRIFGLKPQEFGATYEAFLEAVHPDDRAAVDAAYSGSLRDGRDAYEIVHRIVRKSTGEIRIVQEKCEHIRDKSGRIIRSVGMVQDITEHKKAENELRETRDYLENLLNYANAPVIVWDPQFRISLFNHAFERLTGLSANEVLGKRLEMLFPEDKKEEAMAHIKRTLEGEYWETVEIPILDVDGNVKTVLWNSANIYDPNGKAIVATIAQGHDITVRKQMGKKLEEYSKHLEQLVEERTKQLRDSERLAAIGATAGMVGHDIRNPLQAIIGDIFLAKADLSSLSENEQKTSVQESLSEIEKNVEYISKIVADLQDFAKPLNPTAMEIDLKRIIDEVVSTHRIPGNIQASIKVEKNAERIVADSAYVQRILSNLVNNAVQAMPNGGKLMVHAYCEGKDNVLTVEDTGVGIREEAKSQLFTPLFTTKSKGQGFGLAVVKRMTEALGGTVTFESQAEKGTKFIVRVPKITNSKQVAK